MKNKYPRLLTALCALILSVSSLWAVPAYRGWQQRTLADGTTVTLRQIGDEFYHHWETQDGKIAVEQEDGTFVISDEVAPTGEQVAARRSQSPRLANQRRAKMDYGALQPTKLLVLLVNFSDKKMTNAHDNAFFQKLLNGSFPSVKDYFTQSSGGNYVPEFDVFGPYTLPNNMAYYGGNDSNGDDERPDQMVVDACALAYADGCNFSNYDTNGDRKVDNIYVIYAGYGEAAGAPANTIWPHSWEIYSSNVSGTLTYNGKTLGHYACSAELSGKSGTNSDGVGTFAHEFSHVIGLPDYYDTDYGTNYNNGVTPGEWTLMDQGSYNGSGMYPPLYSVYDKYFMKWHTPALLAKDAKANVTLTTTWDDNYQITGSTSSAACTSTSTVYYIENRQKSGYDQYLPGHGMIVWKVTYSSTIWNNNKVNNTAGTLRYTIVPADGKTKAYGDAKDPFPGTGNKTSYTPATGCALTSIAESSGKISFKYNGGVSGHDVEINATGCTAVPSATVVENGTGLTVNITPTDATYDYTSLTVKLGSSNLAYTLSTDKKTLTINGSNITGDASNKITITVVWTKNRYSYALLGENCTEELEGVIAKDAALNLTIAPDEGYTLADASCWDVEMDGNTLTYGTGFTYNSSTNTFSIANVTGDVSILAYGGRAITWNANGAVHATSIALNNKITLPATSPEACSGKTFVGWCTSSSYSNATTAPTFAKTGDSYSTANYYAVYATATGGGATAWELVEDDSSLKSGDVLVIASNAQGKTAADISSSVMGEVATTFSSDKSTITSLGSGTVELTLGGTKDAWTLTSTGGALGATAVKKLAWGSGTTTWEISISGGNATIQNGNSTYGRFIHNVTNTRFTTYTSGISASMLLPQLYRKSAGVSYSDYTTNCVVCALTSISLNADNVTKTFTTDDTFSSTGLVVTANYSNCSSRTVTPTSVSTPDLSSAGSKTVTVTYTENDVEKTATYQISVAAVVKHTVTWMACGSQFKQEQYVDGAALVLPTSNPPANTEGKAFAGWVAAEYTGSAAPTLITAGGAVTADATYYAIYH